MLLISELEQWINKEESSALDMAEKLSSSSDEFDKLFDRNKQQHQSVEEMKEEVAGSGKRQRQDRQEAILTEIEMAIDAVH